MERYCGDGFRSFDDITDTLMNSTEDTQKHEEKHEEIHKLFQHHQSKEQDSQRRTQISEEKVLGTKFSMSIQTIIGLVSLISGVGYSILSEIEGKTITQSI